MVSAAGYIAPHAASTDEQERALQEAGAALLAVDEDPGPDRPGLWQLVELVRRGDCGVIYVTSIRALGGDVASQEAHRGMLTRAGARVVVLAGDDEPTPERIALRDFDALRTQAERLETRWRLGRGRERAIAAGEWTGGRAPFGWERVAGELVESSREQSAINRAQQLRRGGATLREIAASLTADGYLTKDGREQWSAEQVRRLLIAAGGPDAGPAEGDGGSDPAGAPDSGAGGGPGEAGPG